MLSMVRTVSGSLLAALVMGRAELVGVPGKVCSRNYVCEWFTDLEVQLEFLMALLTAMMINVASSQARDSLASSGGEVVCDEMLAWVVYLVVHNRAGGCGAYLRG
jgi:hypothetical protein